MRFRIDSVIEGKTAPTELTDLCLALEGLIKRLENHEKAEKEITTWRQTAASVSSIQSTGQFLYVGKPVSREKPKTIADLYAQARSSGFAMVAAQQNLVDLIGGHCNQSVATVQYGYEAR